MESQDRGDEMSMELVIAELGGALLSLFGGALVVSLVLSLLNEVAFLLA